MLELEVEGMTCGGCESAVENAVGRLRGVESVRADHRSGRVQVQARGDADVKAINDAIAGAGFRVVSE